MAFAQIQNQWDRLRADQSFINRAVDQILRWTTAVAYSAPDATKDTVREGQKFVACAALVMLLTSATRVEAEGGDRVLVVPGERSCKKRTVSLPRPMSA